MWPERVQLALRFVPGVVCAHTDMPHRTATVGCKSSCDHEALLEALRERGYDGEIHPGS